MAVLIQQVDRRTKLGALLLDVMTTEQVSFENEVTTYPVETGVEISDHITLREKRVSFSGMIAIADITGGWGTASNFGFSIGSGPSESKLVDVIETLERMYEARELVSVSTGQMVYEEMAFTRLSAERSSSAGGGNWVSISAELRRVRKVSLKTADVPAAENVQAGDGAAGRAGETNKAAGSSAGKGSTGQPAQQAPAQPDNRTAAMRVRDNVTTPGTNGFRQLSPAVAGLFGF